MIKKIILIGVLLLFSLLLPLGEYVELNDLAIIRGVAVGCGEEEVQLYLKEVIPVKVEQGIKYQYDFYQATGKNITRSYQRITDKTKKKLYLRKIKFLVTDCKTTEHIMDELHLKDIKIYHVQEDLLSTLKKVNS